MVCEAYRFRIVGCRIANDGWERGVGRKISCLSLNVSEGGLWCLPAKPAFLLCDGSTTENREQRTADRLVLEMLLFKNRRTKSSRNFQKQLLQLFLIKSTNRRNYWDECHVEMVIRPGSLNFYFSTGSAAGLRDDVCLLYTDYIACFCEVIFVRDNVFIMFPWFKWILHLNLSTKSQFSRLKISTFGHENLCVLSTYKAIFFLWKRSFHQDCLQTKLTIMWKMFPYERSFSIWKWSISSTSPPSIFA